MLRPLLLPLLCAGCLAQPPRYKLEVQESVTLQEGQCAFVPCRILYPTVYTWTSSVFGYWFHEGASVYYDRPVATSNPDRAVQEDTKGRFQLLGDPNSNSCSLDIRDARREDRGSYFFRIEGTEKYSYLDNWLSVHVQALTQTPDILIPGTLESGRPMNISCAAPWACRRGTPPIFSWTGATLASALGSETPHGPVLTLTPGPQHHGANITCRVTFPGAANVATERTVQLDVSYAPQNLTISVLQGNGTGPQALGNGSSLRLQEGESLRLACLADSNPPALPQWARGNLLLQPARSSVPGLLELTRAQVEDEGQYVCTAGNALGAQKASVSLLVTGPPELLGPWCSREAEGLRCSCSCKGRPAPSLRWRLGAQLLEGNSSQAPLTVTSSSAGAWTNSSLHLRGPLGSDLRLSCEAQNIHGSRNLSILLLPEKPGAGTGLFLGAAGGAGVTALLAISFCLIFFLVKNYRKKSTEKTASRDGTHPKKGTVSLGHLNASWSDGPPDQTTPAAPTSAGEEEQEYHYASLTFHGMKQPQDQKAASSREYSEIKIRK